MTVRFLGTDIETTETSCSFNGCPGQPIIDPYVNFYVRITDQCRANCAFCPYHNNQVRQFDRERFTDFFLAATKKFFINKVVITGGEPSLNWDAVADVVWVVHHNMPDVPISINTNGDLLLAMGDSGHRASEILPHIHDVALSFHHFRDTTNNEVFRSSFHAHVRDVMEFPDKSKLHLRCNLIRCAIDSPSKVLRYIEFFSRQGVTDFGFVTLMDLNPFCQENFVSYSEAGLDRLKETLPTEHRTREGCSCRNYVYANSQGRLVRYYTRRNDRPGICRSTLVYDQDRLLKGFNGEEIHYAKDS